MKLLSCHIDNFGKLSDLQIDFTKGINLFHEPNGWGKSTLAAFLRVMFYGFDSKKESGKFDKERNVYSPWQGGTYGGELDFEYKGKKYRISRTFGKTEKTDEFHLYDLNTKLECHDFSSDIGTELFGLDSASFKRSAFIAQNDYECGSTDAINAKLGNLVENTNDINNFETAENRIHDKMNKLSPERATGSLKKRKNAMTLLKEELRSYDSADDASKYLTAKLSEKQKQRRELTDIRAQYAKSLQMASEEDRRESLKENYNTICSDVEQRQKELEPYKEVFPERVPEDEEFAKKNQEVQMLGVLKTTIHNLGLTKEEQSQYDKLSDIFENGTPSDKELEDMDHELGCLNELREERSQLETKISYFEALAMRIEAPAYIVRRRMPMLVFGVIFLLASVIGFAVTAAFFRRQPAFVPLLIVEAVVFILGLVLICSRALLLSKDAREAKEMRLKQEEEEKKLREPVEKIQKTMSEASAEIKKIEGNMLAFFGKYHIYCGEREARTSLYELRSQLHEYDRLKTREGRCSAAREEFDRTKDSIVKFGKDAGMDFGEDLAAGISQMQMKAAEYRIAQKNYDEAVGKKDAFEKEYDMEEMASIEKCPYSLDELNSMIQEVDERLEEVRTSIEQYNHQMEDMQEQLDDRDEKEQQLAICEDEQKQETHQYEILGLTQEFLQRAKDQFSARYLGPIEGGFGKYYEFLTGDSRKDWMVNANIDVQMKEQGEMRDLQCMSAGYQALVGICMRLALVDAMYPDEKPFLILDDPFVNLDEEKVAHGSELLRRIASQYQILYFTCNSGRNPR